MAFFGLTALGAQNPFGSMLKDHAILNIFSEDDFHTAFDKVAVSGRSVLLLCLLRATKLEHPVGATTNLTRRNEATSIMPRR